MTIDEAKDIYFTAGGPDFHSSDEYEDVREEMEAVVAAKTDHAAGRLIDWWGCWDRNYTATAFARRVRQRWAEIQPKEPSP